MNDSSPAALPSARAAEPVPAGAVAAPSLPPARRRLSRKVAVRAAIGLVVLLAVLYFGWRWLEHRWAHVSVDDARVGGALVTVSSAVSDIVAEVPISAGDRVVPGQLLLRIDSARTEEELRQIEAMLAGVDAQVTQLKAQQDLVRSQVASSLAIAEAQLAGARAEKASADAALANAKANFDRVGALSRQGVVTQTEFDQVEATYIQAQQQALRAEAGVRTAEATLAGAHAASGQVAVLDRQIEALGAQRTGYAAQRAQKLIDLGQRSIEAAFAGVVDATFVHAGEYASPGQRLFIYHDPDRIWVDANVKETDIRNVALGAPATVTVDAYPGRVFAGEVVAVGTAAVSQFALLPSPNPSGNFTKITQRLPIRIAIDQVDDLLKPGMMVEASIDVVR